MSAESNSSVLFFKPKCDHNRAFDVDFQEALTFNKLWNEYDGQVCTRQIGTATDASEVIRKFPERSIRVIIWSGHGNSGGEIFFGKEEDPDYKLSLENIRKIFSLSNRFHKECIWIMRSCCIDRNILAETIHREMNVKVCAVQNSIAWTDRWCLIRGENNSFEAHFFDESNQDITSIWKDGRLSQFKDRSHEIFQAALSQGYKMNRDELSLERLELMAAQHQHPFTKHCLALRYVKERRFDDAFRCFETALQEGLSLEACRKEEIAKAIYDRGIELKDTRKFEDAILCFKRACQLEGEWIPEVKGALADTHYLQGIEDKKKGDLDKAIQCFQIAHDGGQRNAKKELSNALYLLGEEYRLKNFRYKAIECYEKAANYEHIYSMFALIRECESLLLLPIFSQRERLQKIVSETHKKAKEVGGEKVDQFYKSQYPNFCKRKLIFCGVCLGMLAGLLGGFSMGSYSLPYRAVRGVCGTVLGGVVGGTFGKIISSIGSLASLFRSSSVYPK